jgi:hypothetical protein
VQTSGDPLVADSITQLGPEARGVVVVCASHGGRFAAAYAADLGVRAVVFNDAGVGKDRAGVAGLDLLAERGLPAVAVLGSSARIGDGADTLARGVVGHVNAPAGSLGCRVGAAVGEALARLSTAQPLAGGAIEDGDVAEARELLLEGPPQVWALDSASLVRPSDAGAILLTGSHANLLGGKPGTALKADAFLAVYNDAGSDPTTGCTRLPVLDARGIAAAAVASTSARIGDGRSTYDEGVLTALNGRARELGGRVGMTARELVEMALSSHGTVVA